MLELVQTVVGGFAALMALVIVGVLVLGTLERKR